MNVLAIIGSYRKGRTIDTLVDKAIEGVKQAAGDVSVAKIYLKDKDIKYCTNCMVCRNDDPTKEMATCPIADDMQELNPLFGEADGYIFATPINCGTVTAVMKTFLERTVWVHARPGKRPIAGCPEPRSSRPKRAIIILSSGIVPPLLRRFCDDATSLIKSNCECSYNAKVVGTLYAGAIEKKGLDRYLDKAWKLGKQLAKPPAWPGGSPFQGYSVRHAIRELINMIRAFKDDDLDVILDIWLQASIKAHDFVEPDFWRSQVDTMRNIYIPASETYVCLEAGTIIGFYSLYENKLAALFIRPEFQGRGFGKKLLSHAKRQRKELTLNVYKENEASCRFYLSQGFRVISEQPDEHTGHLEYTMSFGTKQGVAPSAPQAARR